MNHRQTVVRLQCLITRDKRKIAGYTSCGFRLATSKYNANIVRYNGSIERKREALKWVNANPNAEFEWHELCSLFGFSRR